MNSEDTGIACIQRIITVYTVITTLKLRMSVASKKVGVAYLKQDRLRISDCFGGIPINMAPISINMIHGT